MVYTQVVYTLAIDTSSGSIYTPSDLPVVFTPVVDTCGIYTSSTYTNGMLDTTQTAVVYTLVVDTGGIYTSSISTDTPVAQ